VVDRQTAEGLFRLAFNVPLNVASQDAFRLIDAGDGRWLAVGPLAQLAIGHDGQLHSIAAVFSPDEYRRLTEKV